MNLHVHNYSTHSIMMITVIHMNVDEPNPPKKNPTFISVSGELVYVVNSVNGVSVLWKK